MNEVKAQKYPYPVADYIAKARRGQSVHHSRFYEMLKMMLGLMPSNIGRGWSVALVTRNRKTGSLGELYHVVQCRRGKETLRFSISTHETWVEELRKQGIDPKLIRRV